MLNGMNSKNNHKFVKENEIIKQSYIHGKLIMKSLYMKTNFT